MLSETDKDDDDEDDDDDDTDESVPVPKRKGRPPLTEEQRKARCYKGHFQSYKGKARQIYKVPFCNLSKRLLNF